MADKPSFISEDDSRLIVRAIGGLSYTGLMDRKTINAIQRPKNVEAEDIIRFLNEFSAVLKSAAKESFDTASELENLKTDVRAMRRLLGTEHTK